MKHLKQHVGFSLLEAVVYIAIASCVSIAVLTFEQKYTMLNRVSMRILDAQQETRKLFKMMSYELRTMEPSSTGAYPLETGNTTSITFYANIDADSYRERIRYYLSGSSLMKGVLKPTGNPLTYVPGNEVTTTVINDVSNGGTPIFQYYDTNYSGTQSALTAPLATALVRLIKVTLIIDKDPLHSPAPVTSTFQISPRNIKNNL